MKKKLTKRTEYQIKKQGIDKNDSLMEYFGFSKVSTVNFAVKNK
jgi:hypothetical protein